MADLEKTIKALSDRGFEVYKADSSKEAVEKALSFIPEGSSVGWGGSVSIQESGLLDAVKNGKYVCIDRDKAKDGQERTLIMRQALTADYFLTSFNAIGEDGTVINIDGNGNRVAAITFGPKFVIVIAGENKIVFDAEKALVRAKTVAAPKNALRFGMKEEEAPKLCKVIQRLDGAPGPEGRIKVILVKEALGY